MGCIFFLEGHCGARIWVSWLGTMTECHVCPVIWTEATLPSVAGLVSPGGERVGRCSLVLASEGFRLHDS